MAIGLDMGGSSLKVVSLEGTNVLTSKRIPHAARGLEAVLSVLAAAVPPGDEPLGVAIAGLVRGGVVVRSGNLDLREAPVARLLEERTGRRLSAFVSDAHAVGRAALLEDAGEPVVVAIALGTGVGGALIEEGAIVRDEGLGHGTDTGLVALAPCAIGHERCLEAHLGAAALARAPHAQRDAGALLGRALGPLCRGKRARLVLSGGVSESSSLLDGASSTFPGAVVRSRFGLFTAAVGAALAATRP